MATGPGLAQSTSFTAWMEELDLLVRARYPLLYLVSWEEHRVDMMLGDLARNICGERVAIGTWPRAVLMWVGIAGDRGTDVVDHRVDTRSASVE